MRVITPVFRCAVAVLAVSVAVQGDVFYEEEVINSGVGPKKRGARRTVHEVYIKGQRQRVSVDVEASKEMIRVLQKQGKTLQGTTILLLDQGHLYDIDRGTGTYRQQPLPAARPAAGIGYGHPMPKPAPKEDPNRAIAFRTRTLPDSTRILGIRCRRVAAEMTARHFKPGTKEVTRTNRYLYQAWMADDFPGYGELATFRQLQSERTALPPLVRGGLEQLAGAVDDPERLERELEALRGFPMQSELKVFTATGTGEPRRIFQLSRKVLRLTHTTLADSLFHPSRDLKKVP